MSVTFLLNIEREPLASVMVRWGLTLLTVGRCYYALTVTPYGALIPWLSKTAPFMVTKLNP
jgi:hypothetical protein